MTLHCPECKSTKITPVVETTNNGGYAVNTSISRRSSVSNIALNSTHRNYWMCSNCGSKFRNIQNLQDELDSENKKVKVQLGCLVFLAVLAVLIILMDLMVALWPFMLICTAIVLFQWLSTKKKIGTMTQELAYLNAKCFE